MNERAAHSYVLNYQVPCATYGKEREPYELILENNLEVCELDLPSVTLAVAGCCRDGVHFVFFKSWVNFAGLEKPSLRRYK